MTRINISISEELLKEVDSFRFMVKENRSAFMAKALTNYIDVMEKETFDKKRKKAIKEVEKVSDKIGNKLKDWDSTADIRRLRDSRHGI